MIQKITNFVPALWHHIKTGWQTAKPELIEKRLDICDGCEFLDKEEMECLDCGCFVLIKTKWTDQECPQKKW